MCILSYTPFRLSAILLKRPKKESFWMSSVRAAIAAPQCRWLRDGTGEGDQRCTETVTPMQLQFETRRVAHENAHTHILHTDNRYIHVPSTNLASDLCIVRFDWARMQFGNESITGEYWNTQKKKTPTQKYTYKWCLFAHTHTDTRRTSHELQWKCRYEEFEFEFDWLQAKANKFVQMCNVS